MLIHSYNKGIHERIITAKNGQLVRVRFEIIETDGIMRGRIISATPIVSVAGKSAAADVTELYLPLSVKQDIAEAAEAVSIKKPQPKEGVFDFFMSQPTRAPAEIEHIVSNPIVEFFLHSVMELLVKA